MKDLISKGLILFGLFHAQHSFSQHSVAREWNEAMLSAIRKDLARPTVHARNLFHVSVAMYDAWAVYDETATPYLLGTSKNGYIIPFNGISVPSDIQSAREEAISYAAYRLLTYRFADSPGQPYTQVFFDDLMDELGYDYSFKSLDYSSDNPAALGNYIAQVLIDYGSVDNSNEENGYINLIYESANEPLNPHNPGNPNLTHPNRWQPLTFDVFIDQGGNEIPGKTPDFLSPEWGNVFGFALNGNHKKTYEREEGEYQVFHDPTAPPYLNQGELTEESKMYQWNFGLVATWSGHLDPSDNVMIDISPATLGNNPQLPETYYDYPDFYDLKNGGDQSRGYDQNPITGQAYEPQIVPRGDYTRVLAEFWADGPASETPPGHWYTILNYVNDHPMFVKKFKGEGEVLDDLEWDVKAYFTLGGTMHDAAISAWSVKGWYDYIRPISAIRYLASNGQSSDPELSNYHIEGISLVDGYIELVETGDALAGDNDENVGKIKLFAWRGHGYGLDEDLDPEVDEIGVDWILADDWWPYQRVSFVTPPFAGYVSGHSTFSRAAAEVLTMLTGDAYFPGGMGEFEAPMNEFLVFEEGPSIDLTLQWATYRDASDQCSLSRIWGGIHPPADDIPGRKMGIEIGEDAFKLAEFYFGGAVLSTDNAIKTQVSIYPNPVQKERILHLAGVSAKDRISVFNIQGQLMKSASVSSSTIGRFSIDLNDLQSGIYILKINQSSQRIVLQ